MPEPADATFSIRRAVADDAERMIAHVHHMAVEAPQFLPIEPGEFQMTVEEERKLLDTVNASDNSAFLIAEAAGEIVGVLNYFGGKRNALRHAATLGLSVRFAWQNHGVGTALLSTAIRMARESGVIRRLNLYVYADNARAIRLYERHGFVREGVRRKAIRRDGQFIDDYEMALVW